MQRRVSNSWGKELPSPISQNIKMIYRFNRPYLCSLDNTMITYSDIESESIVLFSRKTLPSIFSMSGEILWSDGYMVTNDSFPSYTSIMGVYQYKLNGKYHNASGPAIAVITKEETFTEYFLDNKKYDKFEHWLTANM